MTKLGAEAVAASASPAKLVLDVTDRDLARSIAGALQDLMEPPPQALTVFEAPPQGWRIEAYYDEPRDGAQMSAALTDILGRDVPPFQPEVVPDLNWVAISQQALPPVVAGRFTIHGSHDRGRVARGPNAILIDAGEAFGTAHHATTHGCLTAIDRLTRSGGPRGAYGRILDLGCGSGVLAIAAARSLPRARRIVATDLDRQSVLVARDNMRLNGVGARIETQVAAGLGHPALRGRRFDLLIANILAEPLIRLAPELSRALAPRGHLVLSGLLVPQAKEVTAAYLAAGLCLVSHDRQTGWSTLVLRHRGR